MISKLELFEDKIIQNNLFGFWTPRTSTNLQQGNHRKISPIEVPIDIDIHYIPLADLIIKEIGNRLCNNKISFETWFTGRSYHIHIFYPDLIQYPLEIRNSIRKQIIWKYCYGYIAFIDVIKANENLMIRDFNSTHELIGTKNTLISKIDFGENHLPILQLIKKEEVKPKEFDKNWLKEDRLLYYVLNNQIGKGYRNNILFKCLAIGLLLSDISEEERVEYCKRIIKNCKGKFLGEMVGWLKWGKNKIRQGKNLCINKSELNRFLDYHKLPIEKY